MGQLNQRKQRKIFSVPKGFCFVVLNIQRAEYSTRRGLLEEG